MTCTRNSKGFQFPLFCFRFLYTFMLSITVQLKKNVQYVFIFFSIRLKENYSKGVPEHGLRRILGHTGKGA